jgi:hypothetical protein
LGGLHQAARASPLPRIIIAPGIAVAHIRDSGDRLSSITRNQDLTGKSEAFSSAIPACVNAFPIIGYPLLSDHEGRVPRHVRKATKTCTLA